MSASPRYSSSIQRAHRIASLLAVILALFTIGGLLTGIARADGGGFVTETPTLTPLPTQTPLPTMAPTSESLLIIITETPVENLPAYPLVTAMPNNLLLVTQEPTASAPALACWPFALAFIIFGLIVGSAFLIWQRS